MAVFYCFHETGGNECMIEGINISLLCVDILGSYIYVISARKIHSLRQRDLIQTDEVTAQRVRRSRLLVDWRKQIKTNRIDKICFGWMMKDGNIVPGPGYEVQLPPALQQTMISNFEPKALRSTERCSCKMNWPFYTLFCSSEAEGGQWNNFLMIEDQMQGY